MHSRRQFLKSGAAFSIVTSSSFSLSRIARSRVAEESELFWSAFQDQSRYGMAIFDVAGNIAFEVELPNRGHGAAFQSSLGHIAFTERRPGWYGMVFDLSQRKIIADLKLPKHHHFYGHAAYSGSYLYTTENDYDREKGVIGIWSIAENYQRVGAIELDAIGPHEIITSLDGNYLIVAIGGILTHPDDGRRKLNIPDMQPELIWIDLTTHRIKRRLKILGAEHKASLRHIDCAIDGAVCFGTQWQGDLRGNKVDIPVVGLAGFNTDLSPFSLEQDHGKAARYYCGSVKFDCSGQIVAASAPRGNRLFFFDRDTKKLRSELNIVDICGIAKTNQDGCFVISSGIGKLLCHNVFMNETVILSENSYRWDNHLYRLI